MQVPECITTRRVVLRLHGQAGANAEIRFCVGLKAWMSRGTYAFLQGVGSLCTFDRDLGFASCCCGFDSEHGLQCGVQPESKRNQPAKKFFDASKPPKAPYPQNKHRHHGFAQPRDLTRQGSSVVPRMQPLSSLRQDPVGEQWPA